MRAIKSFIWHAGLLVFSLMVVSNSTFGTGTASSTAHQNLGDIT